MSESFGISKNFEDWFRNIPEKDKQEMDKKCLDFAYKQNLFMDKPIGMFKDEIFSAKYEKVKSLENLVINGPLYRVFADTNGYGVRYGIN